MALTVYFTFSRGGTAAAVLGLVLFMALAHDRVPKVATMLTATTATAIPIAVAGQREALNAGLADRLRTIRGTNRWR